MPLGILFWTVYIISLLAGFWSYYEPTSAVWFRRAGGYFVIWLLVGIIGWRVFGPAVRG